MSWTRNSEAAGSADASLIRARAIALLARREHSRLELRQKLVQRGFATRTLECVLDQLVAEGLLNENRYAELYACSRADKGYGPLRIANELRERGIAQEHVDQVLTELADDWPAKLRGLHRKRFKASMPITPAQRLQQTRVLRQHGFTLEQIRQLFGHGDADSPPFDP